MNTLPFITWRNGTVENQMCIGGWRKRERDLGVDEDTTLTPGALLNTSQKDKR